MKLIGEKSIYIQKNDIMNLLNIASGTNQKIPSTLVDKIYGNGIIIIGNTNRHEFVEFSEQEEIEFLKSQDWIIDYNSVKDIQEDELSEMAWEFTKEKNSIIEKYDTKSEEEQEESDYLLVECQIIDHKVYSLIDMNMYNKGKAIIELPEEFAIQNKKNKPKILSKIFDFKRS